MNNIYLRYFIAVLLGVLTAAVPYGALIYAIEIIGENNFNISPQFIAVIVAIIFLSLGAYITGTVLGRKGPKYQVLPVCLAAPGLYIGIAGFIVTLIVDGKLSQEGNIALFSVLLMLLAITVPFTVLGYNRSSR